MPAAPSLNNGCNLSGAEIRAPESLKSALQRTPRLLLIRLRSLGDSILTLPLVEALHRWRPDLRTDLLIEAAFAAVFSGNPALHETLVLRSRTQPELGGWTRAQSVREIRRRRYPVVLNLHGGTTSLLFSLLSGAKVRIGQESFRGSWNYHHRIPPSSMIWRQERLHTVEHQLSLLRWLNLPATPAPAARIFLKEYSRRSAAQRLESAGVTAGKFIVMHPTATLFTKQWPEQNFARLADLLSERFGFPVIFTSAPHESQVLLNAGKSARRRHHYWSDLNLEELFALIAEARLFVGNDSGPTHAAAALDRPLVVIWGSSNYDAWRPWGTDFEAVRSDLPCMPCPGYACAAYRKPKCILDISVGRVFDACTRLLERTAG